MGREAEGLVTFGSLSGPGRLLLEGDALILRGTVRARIARADLSGWTASGEDLRITTTAGPLVATVGAPEAAAWVRALDRPVPTLAAKLGLGVPLRSVGVTDPVLAAAVAPFVSEPAQMLVVEVHTAGALQAVLAEAGGLVLWVATVKGAASPFGENAARDLLRAAGWTDSKTCRVSDKLAATRYTLARGRADRHMAGRQGALA
jgi:hypothetical protein